MNRPLFSFLLFSTCLLIFNQLAGQSTDLESTFGYYIDNNGQLLDGQIDFSYRPKNKEKCMLTIGEDYTPGYYYTNYNDKIYGKIKYTATNNFFRFTKSDEKNSEKIRPEDCKGYVIANDTFAIIQDFTVEREIGGFRSEEPEFAEVITTINNLTFYQHIRIGGNSIVYTYMVRKGKNGLLESFSKSKRNFKTLALACFGEVPHLARALNSDTCESEDLLYFIKYLDYWNKFQNQDKIYFTNSWEETNDSTKAFFYGIVVNVKEESWTINYYTKKGTLLYQGKYNSLSPMTKEGVFTFYFPSSKIRKKILYSDNGIKDSILEFHPNGNLHYQYSYISAKKTKQTFAKIVDQKGNNILSEDGNGEEIIIDSIQNRIVTRTYKKFQLHTSYYTDSTNNKTYQYTSKSGNESSDASTNRMNLILHYPSSSVTNYNHGIVVVRLLVDKIGKTQSIEIIKGLDNSIDNQVKEYCKKVYKENAWKPLKINKQPVPQEVVLSFLYELKGFSWYRNNYYYNNHWQQHMMWQQQQMMRQQNMMRTMSVPRF